MINPVLLNYPPIYEDKDNFFGLYPVDFILETVIKLGIDWFLTEPKAPSLVYGHLKAPWLATKYGGAKITEITDFIRKYEIKVVQHWSLISENLPCVSIQLLEGNEDLQKTGLSDHASDLDVLDNENFVKGRSEIGYIPVNDNVHIGIHNSNTPDLTKYIYYLIIYILSAFKPDLEARGLQLGTFRATDVSRLNDYLPENIFSRFITFTYTSIAYMDKGNVPTVELIKGVQIKSDAAEEGGIEVENIGENTNV